MVICAFGDLLLDVVVRLEEPLTPGDDAVAATRTGAGGQAANVAAWAASLGATARWVGKRARDTAGTLAAAELAAHGVELLGPEVAGRTGVVVSLVAPGGERTMASDRGVAPEVRADELEPGWFAGCDVLHVSGYALAASPIDLAAVRAAALARAAGARVSLDLSSWRVIRGVGPARFRERLEALGPDIAFGGEAEVQMLGGDLPAPTTVLKHGARGFSLNGTTYAARAAEAVDTTGAGDALAAGFLVGGPEVALDAAASCVGKPGAMP
jgi:ribokinase